MARDRGIRRTDCFCWAYAARPGGWSRLDSQRRLPRGLALAQLAPDPLAAQLAIYLGYIRAGILGATAVGVAFVLPSFLMVLALSVGDRVLVGSDD